MIEHLIQWKQQFENTNNCSFYDEFEAYKQNIQNQQYILQLARIIQTSQMAQTKLIINNNNNTNTTNNNANSNQNCTSLNNNIQVDNHSDSYNQIPAPFTPKGKNKHHKKRGHKSKSKSKSQNLKTQDNNVLKKRNEPF